MSDQRRWVVIISVSSDIGRELALRYHRDGCGIVGTYRSETGLESLADKKYVHLWPCDVDITADVHRLAIRMERLGIRWDTFVSCVAAQLPIGNFVDCDFSEWSGSVHTNFISQLGVLHRLYPYRRQPSANVVYFAGPGTNNPAPAYSALCVSKIALIKICELLDAECRDLNVFTIGPGWVRTKTHYQTLDHPDAAGDNYARTKAFMDSGSPGTAMDDIYRHIEWLISKGQAVAGGRNFSTVHDFWGDEELAVELRSDPDMYKLRRHRNVWKDKESIRTPPVVPPNNGADER